MTDDDTPVEVGTATPVLSAWELVRPFDPVWEITEEQLAEILARWDRLVTGDVASDEDRAAEAAVRHEVAL